MNWRYYIFTLASTGFLIYSLLLYYQGEEIKALIAVTMAFACNNKVEIEEIKHKHNP